MTMLTTIPTSANRPFAWRTAVLLARLRRLANRFFAAVIARHERHATRLALHRLDDRQLKDLAMTRSQIESRLEELRRPARGCSSPAGIDGAVGGDACVLKAALGATPPAAHPFDDPQARCWHAWAAGFDAQERRRRKVSLNERR